MNDTLLIPVRVVLAAALLFAPFWLMKSGNRVAIDAGDASMASSGYPEGGYFIDSTLTRLDQYKPGDVIAYHPPREYDKTRVARILALEGARVQVNEKGAFVNGQLERPQVDVGSLRVPEFRIPEGCVFVLADSSVTGLDSVRCGPVPLNNILGRLKPAN
jgi:signal peptidase I